MSDTHSDRGSAVVRFVVVGLVTAGIAVAQALDELRQQLREDLRQVHFAAGFSSLVALAGDLELSGARYSFDDPSRTGLQTFALPGRVRPTKRARCRRCGVSSAVGSCRARIGRGPRQRCNQGAERVAK